MLKLGASHWRQRAVAVAGGRGASGAPAVPRAPLPVHIPLGTQHAVTRHNRPGGRDLAKGLQSGPLGHTLNPAVWAPQEPRWLYRLYESSLGTQATSQGQQHVRHPPMGASVRWEALFGVSEPTCGG